MKNKIWGDLALDPFVEKYTKGNDLKFDSMLLKYDIHATKAHVAMLAGLQIFTTKELDSISVTLEIIEKEVSEPNYCIDEQYEDGHSFLEAKLIDGLGETGKKVHFLRSRNDQSLTMLRLYMKDKLAEIKIMSKELQTELFKQQKQHKDIPMPGYTHMQKAMPTSVYTWLGSYNNALGDAIVQLDSAQKLVDQNPLGSGAGFGFVGQELQPDKSVTTGQLGFAMPQYNPMYCGMSRGNFELFVLQATEPFMLLASQFASDVLLFTMSEFGFLSLPNNFTTGSSIMPQKHNYDCLEIMRGSESIFWGYIEQIHGLVAKKTSGYQRDLQLSKKAFVEAMILAMDTITMWLMCTQNLCIDTGKLEKSMSPEIYATARANELVLNGMSFRDAYTTIKKEMEK